jgi:hypothetical protein
MYFPYGLWKDAGREARRSGNNEPGGCFYIFMIVFGVLVVGSLAAQGGFGIILAIAILLGIIQGINK